MVGYIYKITNKITNQNYIGQSIDVNRRKNTHFNSLRKNRHENPKLQASWNKYGADNFTFESWEFQIKNLEELNALECEYIEKYEGLDKGFNLAPGGGKPPLRQKVLDDDIATFLCVQDILGDGYGKTCEQIFGWSKGTASAAKRKKRYLKGWEIYENLSEQERLERGTSFIESQHLHQEALKRQLSQGGCEKAYQLTQKDYNFAFAAQELGYTYSQVATFLGIKPSTINDWFRGKSRIKNKETYQSLPQEKKEELFDEVRGAHLEAQGHDKFINKKEEDLIAFLCYDIFFPQNDMDIQRLFGWSEGTCYAIRKKENYPFSKAKVSLLDKEEQKNIAETLQNQLIGHA